MQSLCNTRKKQNSSESNKIISSKFFQAILICLFAMSIFCSAAQAADVIPRVYNKASNELLNQNPGYSSDMNWTNILNRDQQVQYQTQLYYPGYDNSTHPQGTWNSPYTAGVDGFNYNDPQDYTEDNGYGPRIVNGVYTSGPHGGYLTTTHKCRECHAVHQAGGDYKLTRATSRFEVCDWCHGMGAGSGFNIQTDNDDLYEREYNVGHTMGFGVSSGKWKAPDDTYPAYTPPYWLGGFSCFDCHSPHANPSRLLGFDKDGLRIADIANSGRELLPTNPEAGQIVNDTSIFLAGSWLLIRNPDLELNLSGAPVLFQDNSGLGDITVSNGAEITDLLDGVAELFSSNEAMPVNKLQTDWENPIGCNAYSISSRSNEKYFSISEFCSDCHDGNAGLHTKKVPIFSEDRALRNQGAQGNNWRGNYDVGYGHDMLSRSCGCQLKFNPEDSQDTGPNCRNCHKGSSDCAICHNDPIMEEKVGTIPGSSPTPDRPIIKWDRTVIYDDDWRTSQESWGKLTAARYCSNDGFSWPHRTLGWKMLKDDLFGLDFTGEPIGVGKVRSIPPLTLTEHDLAYNSEAGKIIGYDITEKYRMWISSTGLNSPAHDLDSVCLDCHNPYIWNATSLTSHEDDPNNPIDDFNDDLIMRGLP